MDQHPEVDEPNQDGENEVDAEPVARRNLTLITPARRLGISFPTDLIGMYYLG